MELRENKSSILEILFDMFRNHAPSKIISTCEENQWKLENCIEKLLQSDIQTNQGAVPKPNPKVNANLYFESSSKEKKVLDLVHAGCRVLVIMRGPPGSGKSFFARLLVKRIMPNIEDNSLKDYIFSTDDYFTNKRGIYNRQVNKLSEAHYFNQKQVEKKAIAGANLIVVDNTNLQIWEMIPYVKIALKHNYNLEILEPKTPWRKSVKQLAAKNSHGVPLEKIKIMMDKYEPTTAEQLISMFGDGTQPELTARKQPNLDPNKTLDTAPFVAVENINSSNQMDQIPLPQRTNFRSKKVQEASVQNILKDSNKNDQPTAFQRITGNNSNETANKKAFVPVNETFYPQNNQRETTHSQSFLKDLPAFGSINMLKNEFVEEKNDELVEIQFERNLIWQLVSLFGLAKNDEVCIIDDKTDFLNVFIPRALARDLYDLCCKARNESVEKQTKHVDENFAKLVQISKFSEISEAPKNLQELLDYEAAVRLLNAEKQELEKQQNFQDDLATYLSKTKLADDFIELPKQLDTPAYETRQEKNVVYGKEEKNVALSEFEEFRNLAVHHCQLKAECYQKAKEMVQKGNNAVAGYYSQIARFHKNKIDMYNERAANCIVEVHRITSTNGDVLDLHHLHAAEAIECLDLFLDHHISNIRGGIRSYKNVFIITGRGLHSTGGVSVIKSKVKNRLKDRNLKWNEANPGLLKVKIFSSSRFSK